MDFEEALRGTSKEEYGPSYSTDVLEIYKMYMEMADRISSRRQTTNSFFLTINTAVVGLMGYFGLAGVGGSNEIWYLPIAIAGIALSYLWFRIIRSYKDLNSAKFKVIYEIEEELPLRPYDAEWEAVGRGKKPKLYLPFTHVELFVPWVFVFLHVLAALRAIPWGMLHGSGAAG